MIKITLILKRLKGLYMYTWLLVIGSGVTICGVISKHMGRMLRCVVRYILIDCLTSRTG